MVRPESARRIAAVSFLVGLAFFTIDFFLLGQDPQVGMRADLQILGGISLFVGGIMLTQSKGSKPLWR